jgi:Putative DNA-binding domain
MFALHQTEEWMLSVITHPTGLQAASERMPGPCSGQVRSPELQRIIRGSEAWSPEDRLMVYRNAYFARLLGCLHEDFPVLLTTLGEESFDAFMLDYLQAVPPNSYTLSRLGAGLSGHLRASRPVRDYGDSGPDWADFLAELAEFEWLITEVFDGPGHEVQPRPTVDQRSSPTGVEPSPSLRLCEFQFPVADFHARVRTGGGPVIPAPQLSRVAVVRDNFVVRHFPLTGPEFTLLQALQTHRSLIVAMESLFEQLGEEESAVVDEAWVSSRFAEWTRFGFLLPIPG